MALFKRVEETKTAIKVLAYGASGTGKTTFSLSFPSVVAIDAESGMSFYKNNPNLKYILETTSAEEVEEAMEEIEDELIGEVGTLVIDSETKIYENQQHGALELVEKRARKKSQNVEDANISQREWGKIKLVSKRMQSAKIKLSSMGVSIVSIAQMKEIKEKKGDTFVTVGYAPDCGKGIEYDYDVVLRLFTEKDKVTGLDSLVAEADSTAIYTRPGIVKFTVHVTNNGAVDATNVKVVSSGVTVYPYNTSSGGVTLAPGQTLSFVRDVLVETPGTFRFDATAAGQLGETVTFNGNELRIFYAPPTATPSMVPVAAPVKPTEQPLPTSDTLPESYDKAEELLNIGFWVALALAGVSLALILVGIVGRAAANAKAANAAENIQRVRSNDYGKSVPKRKRRYLPESESTVAVSNEPAEAFEPIEAPAEFTEAAPEELAAAMEETMTELYPEAVMEADAPAAPAYEPYEGEFTAAPEYAAEPSADDLSASVAAAPVEEPTYRRRRRSDK